MSNYVHSSSLSYSEYLQARNFEDSLHYEISSNSQQLIGTAEQLAERQMSVVNEGAIAVVEALSGGFEMISDELTRVSEQLCELSCLFNRGFSEVLSSLGHISDDLQDLIKISKSPAQTWAYEQFDIARDALRQDLIEEALMHLDRAINGYGSNPGYQLEYRFYYLTGTIRLGNARYAREDYVDSVLAEDAFLKAARYGRKDFPDDAAHAYQFAAWAAYTIGENDRAIKHIQDSIALNNKSPETYFLAAKFYAHAGDKNQTIKMIKKAITNAIEYSIKALADGDLKKYEKEIIHVIDDEKHRQSIQAKQASSRTKKILLATEIMAIGPYALSENSTASIALSRANEDFDAGEKMEKSGTLLGLHDSQKKYSKCVERAARAKKLFAEDTVSSITAKIAELEKIQGENNNRHKSKLDNISPIFALWGGVFGAIYILFFVIRDWEEKIMNDGFWHAAYMIIGSVIVGAILIVVGAAIGYMLGKVARVFVRKNAPQTACLEKEIKEYKDYLEGAVRI